MSAWEARDVARGQNIPEQPARGVSTDVSGTSTWRKERPIAMILLPDPDSWSGWSNHRVMAQDAEEEEPARIGFRR